MEPLLKIGDFVEFIIDFQDGDFQDEAHFTVHKVVEWEKDFTVLESQLYLTGVMRSDTSLEVVFGQEKDGWVMFYGKVYVTLHCHMMNAIYEVCAKKIKNWQGTSDVTDVSRN